MSKWKFGTILHGGSRGDMTVMLICPGHDPGTPTDEGVPATASEWVCLVLDRGEYDPASQYWPLHGTAQLASWNDWEEVK